MEIRVFESPFFFLPCWLHYIQVKFATDSMYRELVLLLNCKITDKSINVKLKFNLK